jgi:hypothetical protein
MAEEIFAVEGASSVSLPSVANGKNLQSEKKIRKLFSQLALDSIRFFKHIGTDILQAPCYFTCCVQYLHNDLLCILFDFL